MSKSITIMQRNYQEMFILTNQRFKMAAGAVKVIRMT